MKHTFLLILLCCTCFLISIAQNNSTVYYTKNWKVTSKDSAYYYSVFSNDGAVYKRTDYLSKSNNIHMYGSFSDKETKTREGASIWYYDNGFLKDSIVYKKGVKMEGISFYDNGKKKEEFTTVNGNVHTKGWDKGGGEIPNYILERQAEFTGGSSAWRKYLEKNLQLNFLSKASLPNGTYTVKIKFAVDEKGKVSEVKAVDFPPLCPFCAVEAARVVQKAPDWSPAIKLGKPVRDTCIQFITFQKAGNYN